MPDPLNDESAPPETVTSPTAKLVDDSDSVNVMVSVSPVPSDPEPARVIVTVGACVSYVIESVELARLVSPVLFENAPAATESVAVPLAPAVGVKVAV